MGLGEAEQLCTLSVDMCSCLYATVQLAGASLAVAEVSLRLLEEVGKTRHTAVCVELLPQLKTAVC